MRAALIGAVALAVLAAGCSARSESVGGTATTGGPRTPLAIPAVANPLDTTAFADAPCGLLSEPQATELGLPFAERESPAGRMACTWRAVKDDPYALETMAISVDTDDGLSGFVQMCGARTECDSWTVDTIAGYPVIRGNSPLESKYGFCRLFVGVADTMSFTVTDGKMDAISEGATEGNAVGPQCDRAERAATMVIQTLKEGR